MKNYTVLLFFVLISYSISAQTTFEKTYGTRSTDEVAFGGVSTETGNILLLNRIQNPDHGTYDMQLLMLDKDGEQLWAKDYSTPDFNEEILNLYSLPSGGYLLTAKLKKKDRSFGGFVMRVDASGEMLWMNSAALDNSVLIATAIGENNNPTFLTWNQGTFHLLEMDDNQNIIWEKELSDAELTLLDFNSIAATKDGGYILSGTGHLVAEQDRLMLLYKVDNKGDREWYQLQAEQYATSVGADSNTPQGEHVIQTEDGGYLHIGRTNRVIKRMAYRTDSKGETIWYAEDGSSIPDRIDVIERADGSFLISYGERRYSSKGDISYLDAEGNLGSYQAFNSGLMGLIPIADGSNDFYTFGDSGRRSLDMDATLFYCNTDRKTQWTKTFGQTANKHEEVAYGIANLTESDETLVFGFSNANPEGLRNWKLSKVDKETGILNSEKQLSGNISYFIELIALSDGNFLLYGIGYDSNSFTRFMKVNTDGEALWETDIANIYPYKTITENENGEILIATKKNFQNFVLIKLGNEGEVLSEVNLPQSYEFYNVLSLENNRLILVGNASNSSGINGTPMIAMEVDSNGNIVWQTQIEDDSSDFKSLIAQEVLLSQSGNLIIASEKDFDNVNKGRVHLASLSTNGNIQWEKDIAEFDKSISIENLVETPSGNIGVLFNTIEEIYRAGYSLTGTIARTESGNIIQTDANGELLWSEEYGSDIGYGTVLFDLELAEDGGFIATGYIDYQNSRDMYIFKTDTNGTIVSINPFQKSDFRFHVFPNPNQGVFKIELEEKMGKSYTLEVFDAIGKQHLQQTLFSNHQALNLSHLSSGIYFLQLTDGQQFAVKQIIIE